MSAATYVLAINLFVAGLFTVAFGTLAAFQRSARSAIWLSVAYGSGIITAVFEFLLPYQTDHRPVSMAIAVSFLVAITGCQIGLARHYRQTPPWKALAFITIVSLAIYVIIIDMPRDSFVRGVLYQAPYSVVQLVGVWIIFSQPRKGALDYALLTLFMVCALHFLAKPVLSEIIGSGPAPQSYLGSTYAAISQTIGAVMIISNGLLTLLIIVRDVLAEVLARSKTDTLSGLLNRRGFETHAERALLVAERAQMPLVMIQADLDHFKQINDSYGHAAGDEVICAFANVLKKIANEQTLIGRVGGEEFVVLVPGANLTAGRLFAETARSAFAGFKLEDKGISRPVSASFGVAQYEPGQSLPDLMRRTDIALYHAKAQGRDRVCVADRVPTEPGPMDVSEPRLVTSSR